MAPKPRPLSSAGGEACPPTVNTRPSRDIPASKARATAYDATVTTSKE